MGAPGFIHRRGAASGYALIDALIAFLIAAIGIYGLVITQTRMALNADVAKQRGEATRLAQQRVEDLRAFTTIAPVAGQLAWNDLASGSDTINTNAAYTRRWTISGNSSSTMRSVDVSVSWTDRAGDDQSVLVASVISKTDPANVGSLGFPLPANTTLKRPKNRSMNIPVPAIELGEGKSVYQLASNFAVIFSNDSGYVVQKCSKVVSTLADLNSGCEAYDAFILAGYVSRTMASWPATLGISTAELTGLDGGRAVQCSFADATDQNDGTTIAGYKYYLCILPIVTGGNWSGTVRLTGMASGTDYRVCRFEQPDAPGVTNDQRNVQPYTAVDESLDNQNYVVTTGGGCPTLNSLATTLHQACVGSGAARTSACPAS